MIYATTIQAQKTQTKIAVRGAGGQSKSKTKYEINALYALLGGYNQVARLVDIDTYNEIRHEFEAVIEKMAHNLVITDLGVLHAEIRAKSNG